ncbi:carotenoid biosynthesis protein [Roseiflexus castenholzii]|uniref:carotenoid biosynthesis protein n=1 Tax=Roseiflexus castenholzii TaxID=120962 RepID=UPI003C7E3553
MSPSPLFQWLSLACFFAYCAVFPGSTITVALNAVPSWGLWMGAAMLIVQGLAVIFWGLGMHGARGGLAVGLAAVLAWAVEHIGETTGWPFGRYQYTEMLQPQILGIVPVPITLAWLMAGFGSWQLARLALGGRGGRIGLATLTGVLIVVLDLQIETVATFINAYWTWIDTGPYYQVPPQNFVGWWIVGFLMALIMTFLLPPDAGVEPADASSTPKPSLWARTLPFVWHRVPALLYMLSSIFFTAANLARGYPLAGLVGVIFLAVAGWIGATQRRHQPRHG